MTGSALAFAFVRVFAGGAFFGAAGMRRRVARVARGDTIFPTRAIFGDITFATTFGLSPFRAAFGVVEANPCMSSSFIN